MHDPELPVFDDAGLNQGSPSQTYLQQALAAVLDADGLPPIVQAGHPVLRARALPSPGSSRTLTWRGSSRS